MFKLGVFLSFAISIAAQSQATDPPRPLIVAHRGLLLHAPENTLANFRACLELRLGFEFDVQRSKRDTAEKMTIGNDVMRKRVWQRVPPKPPPKPKVPEDLKASILVDVDPIVADLKKRFCKKPKNPQFNCPEDIFVRWHRDALYFVVVMRTPHDRPPTFESHVARMEHTGGGKFNLAVPMRRGWNTIRKDQSPEECLKEIPQMVYL